MTYVIFLSLFFLVAGFVPFCFEFFTTFKDFNKMIRFYFKQTLPKLVGVFHAINSWRLSRDFIWMHCVALRWSRSSFRTGHKWITHRTSQRRHLQSWSFLRTKMETGTYWALLWVAKTKERRHVALSLHYLPRTWRLPSLSFTDSLEAETAAALPRRTLISQPESRKMGARPFCS